MPNIPHPEFSIEQEQLAKTLHALDAKLASIERRKRDDTNIPTQNALVNFDRKQYARLNQIRDTPYFGRLDVKTVETDEPETFYLGKQDIEFDGIRVLAWETPIGDLFYKGRPGRNRFTTPDGERYANLFLKRLFELEARRLLAMHDEYDTRAKTPTTRRSIILDPDQYLQEVLDGKRDAQMRDIVATIQREQNALIRADPRQVLIVQGVAGSGKTSVALHRLAYLLYPGTKSGIDPRRCILFGPNRFFLGYISAVLPGLGVEGVKQTTITDWVLEQLDLQSYQVTDVTLDAILGSAPRETKLSHYFRSRWKNVPAMGQLLRNYIEARRKVIFPPEGLVFENVGPLDATVRITPGQLEQWHTELSSLPLNRHREQFIARVQANLGSAYDEAVRRRTNELAEPGQSLLLQAEQLRDQATQILAQAQLGEQFIQDVGERTALLDDLNRGADALTKLASVPQQQGERIINQANSRREFALNVSARQEVITSLTRRAATTLQKLWKPIQLPNDYYQLLADAEQLRAFAQDIYKPEQLAQLVQEPPLTKIVDASDMAALHFLHTEINSVPVAPFDHIVVDEAQDVSPLQFETLRRYSRNGSLTVLGDLAQSIYAHRGIANWNEVRRAFPEFTVKASELVKSYRSTYEIIQFANVVLQTVTSKGGRAPIADVIKRHGPLPELHRYSSDSALSKQVQSVVTSSLEEGYRNIAIVGKTVAHCERLAELFKRNDFNAFHLVKSAEFKYEGGTIIAPVHLAKGMEFDVALIVDVDAETYSETEFDGRLLYVALTRPLHVLHLFWSGKVAKQLEKAVAGLEREKLRRTNRAR